MKISYIGLPRIEFVSGRVIIRSGTAFEQLYHTSLCRMSIGVLHVPIFAGMGDPYNILLAWLDSMLMSKDDGSTHN